MGEESDVGGDRQFRLYVYLSKNIFGCSYRRFLERALALLV
jgi:hypothetical protein